MPLLPFLRDRNRMAGSTGTEYRTPDETSEKSDNGLEACAADILRAIKEDDVKALAGALQAAYDVCENTNQDDPSISEEGLE